MQWAWLALGAALLFGPFYSSCDRWIGRGNEGRQKPMLTAILGGALLGGVALGPWFIAIGPLWGGWRSLSLFGSLAPQTDSQRVAALCRYLIWVPFSLLALPAGGSAKTLAVLLGAAALVSFGMRLAFGVMVLRAKAERRPLGVDFNATVEKVTGGVFGLALTAYALLQAGVFRM